MKLSFVYCLSSHVGHGRGLSLSRDLKLIVCANGHATDHAKFGRPSWRGESAHVVFPVLLSRLWMGPF